MTLRPGIDRLNNRAFSKEGKSAEGSRGSTGQDDGQVARLGSGTGLALLLADGVGVVGQAKEVAALVQDGVEQSEGLSLGTRL
jgi:hypothetical protein